MTEVEFNKKLDILTKDMPKFLSDLDEAWMDYLPPASMQYIRRKRTGFITQMELLPCITDQGKKKAHIKKLIFEVEQLRPKIIQFKNEAKTAKQKEIEEEQRRKKIRLENADNMVFELPEEVSDIDDDDDDNIQYVTDDYLPNPNIMAQQQRLDEQRRREEAAKRFRIPRKQKNQDAVTVEEVSTSIREPDTFLDGVDSLDTPFFLENRDLIEKHQCKAFLLEYFNEHRKRIRLGLAIETTAEVLSRRK